jgi:tetratricopeptide (TPR) repeat protein
LPTSGSGLEALARGEVHLAAGRWSDALRAYQRAVQIDSTCILCSWRITEVERWHVRPPSPQHIGRTMAARDAFPAPFRPLIVSRSLPLQARLDTLVWAAERWRAFHPASFLLGTELFHRGPLLGRPRAEAEPWLLNALALYPDFAPTWELLAWIRIADGRRAAADSALDALTASDRASPPDPLATSMRALLRSAYAYRFDPSRADDLVDSLLSSTSGEMPDLAAGPRLLLAFEAPDGAVALGSRFAFSDSPTLARSGWIARILGFFARGQLDSALAAGREAQARGHDDLEIQSLAPRLLVAWALLDEAGTPALDAMMIGSLRSVADTPDRGAPARQSAAWLLRLLDGRSANRLQADPTAIESAGVPALRELIRADSLARLGLLMAALENLDDRIDHQSATAVVMRDGTFSEIDNIPDIFYRTVLNGLTAAWNNRLGRVDITLERLRWHEHFDQHVLPMSRPRFRTSIGRSARWLAGSVPSCWIPSDVD